MKISIEIKPTYTVLTPESSIIDKTVVEAILQKTEDSKTSGHYFIVDLKHGEIMESNVIDSLLKLHKEIYEREGSIVFTNLSENVLQAMKREQLHLSINLTPTMEEAVDIISMEILERDLLNEL